MEHLTTDNPHNNTESALNRFYIKDNETWVRGGGAAPDYPDVSLYDFTRKIIKTHNLEIPTADDEAMGDCLAELLFDGTDTIEGIVATLYAAGWAFSALREVLKAYEDTGLMPEEITSTDEFLKENYNIPFKRLVEAYELLMAKDRGEIAVSSPHTPLTREKLREMDGEPVRVCWDGHADVCWALVKVGLKANDVIYLRYSNGEYDFLEDLLDKGGKIYATGGGEEAPEGGEAV